MLPITLVAIDTDPLALPLIRYAVERTLVGLNVTETLFFGTHPLNIGENFIRIAPFDSMDSYSEFVIKCLWPYITTEFMLIVQWDGFVTNPHLWEDEFLRYDYIGAPWPFYNDSMRVGNGGFSIRSQRLLQSCKSPTFRRYPELKGGGAEDVVICRIYRKALESTGITFAPEDLAGRFSHEIGPYPGSTFGFHGPFNMPLNIPEKDLIVLAKPLRHRIHKGPILDAFIQNCRAMNYHGFVEIFEN